MIRRLLLLLVALAVAGAPVALEACQIECTSSAAHGGRSCHGDGDGPRLSHVPDPCGYDAADQPPARVDAAKASSLLASPALDAILVVAAVGLPPALTRWPTGSPQTLLPSRLRAAVPLRI